MNMFTAVYFHIQGSSTNLNNKAIGVDLHCVTELNPARVGTGPGLSQTTSQDSSWHLRLCYIICPSYKILLCQN